MDRDGSSLTILMIRHATPIRPRTPGYEENDRPLTEAGILEAARLAQQYAATRPDAIYSSPYRRAFQTVEPIAQHHRVAIEVIDDLRERLLVPQTNPDDEWKQHLERSWQDFDYALPGAETGRIAQTRVLRVLDDVRARHPSGLVMIGSHGNLIALALNVIDSRLGMDFWAAMPMPAVYRLEATRGGWRIVSGPNVR